MTDDDWAQIKVNSTYTQSPFDIHTGEKQKAKLELGNKYPPSEAKTLQLVLPMETISPETQSTTFFTYRAQLTFGLPQSSEGVNVAKYFQRWI